MHVCLYIVRELVLIRQVTWQTVVLQQLLQPNGP